MQRYVDPLRRPRDASLVYLLVQDHPSSFVGGADERKRLGSADRETRVEDFLRFHHMGLQTLERTHGNRIASQYFLRVHNRLSCTSDVFPNDFVWKDHESIGERTQSLYGFGLSLLAQTHRLSTLLHVFEMYKERYFFPTSDMYLTLIRLAGRTGSGTIIPPLVAELLQTQPLLQEKAVDVIFHAAASTGQMSITAHLMYELLGRKGISRQEVIYSILRGISSVGDHVLARTVYEQWLGVPEVLDSVDESQFTDDFYPFTSWKFYGLLAKTCIAAGKFRDAQEWMLEAEHLSRREILLLDRPEDLFIVMLRGCVSCHVSQAELMDTWERARVLCLGRRRTRDRLVHSSGFVTLFSTYLESLGALKFEDLFRIEYANLSTRVRNYPSVLQALFFCLSQFGDEKEAKKLYHDALRIPFLSESQRLITYHAALECATRLGSKSWIDQLFYEWRDFQERKISPLPRTFGLQMNALLSKDESHRQATDVYLEGASLHLLPSPWTGLKRFIRILHDEAGSDSTFECSNQRITEHRWKAEDNARLWVLPSDMRGGPQDSRVYTRSSFLVKDSNRYTSLELSIVDFGSQIHRGSRFSSLSPHPSGDGFRKDKPKDVLLRFPFPCTSSFIQARTVISLLCENLVLSKQDRKVAKALLWKREPSDFMIDQLRQIFLWYRSSSSRENAIRPFLRSFTVLDLAFRPELCPTGRPIETSLQEWLDLVWNSWCQMGGAEMAGVTPFRCWRNLQDPVAARQHHTHCSLLHVEMIEAVAWWSFVSRCNFTSE